MGKPRRAVAGLAGSLVLGAVPVAAQEIKLTGQAPGGFDTFGDALAREGDVVVVGSAGYTALEQRHGAVFVFGLEGGEWVKRQRLGPGDPVFRDRFGDALALEGTTLVVGAPQHDLGGAVYVFSFDGSAWLEVQELTAADAAAGDRFGAALALEGDTLVVGADEETGFALSDAGAAYVFTREAGSWSELQKLTASVRAPDDHFGASVALAGDTLVVGMPGHDGLGTDAGSAWVFEPDGGTWTEVQTLTASDGGAGQEFGTALALLGTELFVGAPGGGLGAAYRFTDAGGAWSEVQTLAPASAPVGARFGDALDGEGALLAVGGTAADAAGAPGAAWIFGRDAGGLWSERRQLAAFDAVAGDRFGEALALDGGLLLVGAPGRPVGATPDVGAAYLYGLAAAATRNAGTNPDSYAAALPVLGATWIATVDLATTGHDLAFVVAFDAPAQLTLTAGQVVLVGGVQLAALGPASGPSAQLSTELPADPGLVGWPVFTQAVHLGGVVPFALSNAQDLVPGF